MCLMYTCMYLSGNFAYVRTLNRICKDIEKDYSPHRRRAGLPEELKSQASCQDHYLSPFNKFGANRKYVLS